MEELKKQLAEIRRQLEIFAGDDNLTEDEAKKIGALKSQETILEAKIAAKESALKAADDAKVTREREIKEAKEQARREALAEANRLPMSPHQTQYADTNKYDNLSAAELGLVIDVLQTNNRRVPAEAYKAMSLKVAELKGDNTEDGDKAVKYVKGAFKAAMHIEATPEAVSAAVKGATDPLYTGGTTDGAYWVGTAYSADLWRAIRMGTVVGSRVPEIVVPDGFNSIYVPLESSDPTWYKVAEATSADGTLKVPAATVTASQIAVNRKQITLGKLGARVMYSGELTEDSLVNFVPQLREQLQISGAEILEHVIVDGDIQDCTSVNINAIDTQPGEAEVYFLCDGFRKLALVTNTANSRSAGGALACEDYVSTLKLMGTAGMNAADPRQVAFIVDGNVHWANMNIPEVKTRDVFSAATIENGFVTRMYNYPVIPSWQMHRASAKRMANTAGKIDADTDSNNTTGSILAVRFDQWKQAFKRRMTLETTRIANADSWEIVALMRWGMGYRDNEASAISYNVGI